MSHLSEFVQRVTSGEAISLSVFEDAHASWAKAWEDCVRVRVEFGLAVLYLTPAEFTNLLPAHKDLIRHARSSPPVP